MYLKLEKGNLTWVYQEEDWQYIMFESGMDERVHVKEYTRKELASMTRQEFRFLIRLQEYNESYYPPFIFEEDNYDDDDVCRINGWLI